MAVNIEDIKKLRHMTGAGMMDCKNALAETNGDIEAAIEIIRKKGQAVAAKRNDRTAAEGCVLSGTSSDFAAIVTLKCETDFVAKNESFRDLTKKILATALEQKAKSRDELLNMSFEGRTVAEHITDEIGKTGEKMELGDYEWLEAASVCSYDHLGNKLATIVGFNQAGVSEEIGKEVAMQVAAMNPVSVSRDDVPAEIVQRELEIAIDKTKEEQVKKAVENALKKKGYNLYISESEDHLKEGIMKGAITEEDAADIRNIKETVAAEKAANLPEQMIQNIANGRLNKFFKESVLLEQEYHRDAKKSVQQYLDGEVKGLTVVAFRRVNLNED